MGKGVKMATKTKFYTAYNRPTTEPAPAGSKEEPVYMMQIDLKGNKTLIQTGKTNIYDIIQESLEQSKIETIIRRATEGDPYALTMMNGQYIDTTDVPATLAEAQRFVIHAKEEFDQLPINIRRQFDMSAEKYIANYGTSNWLEIMGVNNESNQKTNTTTTKNDRTDQNRTGNSTSNDNTTGTGEKK